MNNCVGKTGAAPAITTPPKGVTTLTGSLPDNRRVNRTRTCNNAHIPNVVAYQLAYYPI